MVVATNVAETSVTIDGIQHVVSVRDVEPDLTISGFFKRIPFPLDSMARTYAEALREAGVPD